MKYLKPKTNGSPTSITKKSNNNNFSIPILISETKKESLEKELKEVMNSQMSHYTFVNNFNKIFKCDNFEFDSDYLKTLSISRKSYLIKTIQNRDSKELLESLKSLNIVPTYDDIKEKIVIYSSSNEEPKPEPRMAVVPVAVYDLAAIVANAAVSANVLAGINLIAVYNAVIKSHTKIWKSASTFQSTLIYPPLREVLEIVELKSDYEFAKKLDDEIFEYIVETVIKITDEAKQNRKKLYTNHLQIN
ncbi:TPA: hypothetical protein ACN1ND_000328 [Enterococcus faecalis]|nr:hypothetical protein [Enterococcus faecalis]